MLANLDSTEQYDTFNVSYCYTWYVLLLYLSILSSYVYTPYLYMPIVLCAKLLYTISVIRKVLHEKCYTKSVI